MKELLWQWEKNHVIGLAFRCVHGYKMDSLMDTNNIYTY